MQASKLRRKSFPSTSALIPASVLRARAPVSLVIFAPWSVRGGPVPAPRSFRFAQESTYFASTPVSCFIQPRKKAYQLQQIIEDFIKCPKKPSKPTSMWALSPTAKLMNKNSLSSREYMRYRSSTLLLTLLKLAIWPCRRRSRAQLLYYRRLCQCLRCLSRLLLQQCVAWT